MREESPEGRKEVPVPEFPRAREDVVFRELAEEWVVFDPESQELHVLNLPAALVWTHCTGEHGMEEIARRVRESYGDAPPEEEVRSDVREVLRSFVRKGLLA